MKVVHCMKEVSDFYLGRKSSFHLCKGQPVDLSILSNPEKLKDESDRNANLKRYSKYLDTLCDENETIREIIRNLPSDAKLGCFCAPKKCHCNIVINKHNEIRLFM